jgi:hypothetical protein
MYFVRKAIFTIRPDHGNDEDDRETYREDDFTGAEHFFG